MSTSTPVKQGAPITPVKREEKKPKDKLEPVIPTSWLAPEEQRRLVLWTFGLLEVRRPATKLTLGDEVVGLNRTALHRASHKLEQGHARAWPVECRDLDGC